MVRYKLIAFPLLPNGDELGAAGESPVEDMVDLRGGVSVLKAVESAVSVAGTGRPAGILEGLVGFREDVRVPIPLDRYAGYQP